jgi:hypothetical protein
MRLLQGSDLPCASNMFLKNAGSCEDGMTKKNILQMSSDLRNVTKSLLRQME